jgi:hypothetical protein
VARRHQTLIDYLIGAGEEGFGHCEAEPFRGLQIHNKLVLSRSLHR